MKKFLEEVKFGIVCILSFVGGCYLLGELNNFVAAHVPAIVIVAIFILLIAAVLLFEARER